MPEIAFDYLPLWTNYHRTRVGGYGSAQHNPALDGRVREAARIFASDLGANTGPDRFAQTGAKLMEFYRHALLGRMGKDDLFKLPPASDCVPVGSGWSFSSLVGATELQIDLSGLSGCAMARAADLHHSRPATALPVALVSGGTRLRELVNWAKPQGFSIRTSGTHLGMTIAGGAGTSTHGSRLHFGGLQNQIAGMHIVTGPDSSVWIERASAPVLSDACVATFSNRPAIREDAAFDDALVHLGGMGIVNGVAFEMVKTSRYHRLVCIMPADTAILQALSDGRMRDVAKYLGHDAEPIFCEVTFDPWAVTGPRAVYTMLFDAPAAPPPAEASITPLPRHLTVADAISAAANAVGEALKAAQPMWVEGDPPPGIPSAFAYYATHAPLATIDPHSPGLTWDELHPHDVITGGCPGALYNASYAINRSDFARAIVLIGAAVANPLPKPLFPAFIFTVRFVSNASGTLAFTRFPESAVIEIDGFSENAPEAGGINFGAMGQYTALGAHRIRAALDGAGIEYSMHWAKLGDLDAAKVERDFGPASSPTSPIGRWRATRARLLTDPAMRQICRNDGLAQYGLI